ncbi:hypothetical protein GJ699_02665 [Duganella sp. FT80W]|uniref:Uncharacterized protein n=1 Tax=Duganella guangzhouensis TaxID=2666084 RepID=A0A6I2KTE7_9BURK|nr:hypothetical protein [Duganella guangzhouensis]MRW88881.1 hypothetical protein [Duganella guangzhouensis]
MTTYARIAGGLATDVTTTDPHLIFHPLVAAEFYIVPDDTPRDEPLDPTQFIKAPKPDA